VRIHSLRRRTSSGFRNCNTSCGVGGKKGSKYLRARRPLTLVFQQKVGNRSQALKMECAVKNLSKPVKEQVAKGDLKLDDLTR